MAADTSFDWQACYGSLCDSPVEPCDRENIPADHPVRRFESYWRTLARAGMPARAEFDPSHTAPLLKWFMILEEGGPSAAPTFTVRLHGTAAAALTHGDFTGRELAEFTVGDCYQTRLAAIRRSIAHSEPVFGSATLKEAGLASTEVWTGMFPFRTTAAPRHQIVVVVAPVDPALQRLL